MTEILEALAILAPFLVVAWMLVGRFRLGEAPNRMFLVGIAAMAVGAGFWLLYGNNAEVDLPWTWVVGLLLGLIAVATVVSARVGERLLVVTAAMSPVIGVLTLAWVDAFGSGVSDGAGGTYSFMEMLPIALILPLAFYALPAAVTAYLFIRPTSRPPAATGLPSDGWYPDPADPTIQRHWNGTAWTDETMPVG